MAGLMPCLALILQADLDTEHWLVQLRQSGPVDGRTAQQLVGHGLADMVSQPVELLLCGTHLVAEGSGMFDRFGREKKVSLNMAWVRRSSFRTGPAA